MTRCLLGWLVLLITAAANAAVPYRELRLQPPPGWTTCWRSDGLHLAGTSETGAGAWLTGPHDPGGDFVGWFAQRVRAAQEHAVGEGQPQAFTTAGGLAAMRQTWDYVWSAIFIVGTMNRTDLALVHDGQAYHLYVETGRTPEVHQTALRAMLAMLDTVAFGPDAPPEPERLGDLRFALPEGWERCDRDGDAILRPTGLRSDELVELRLLPRQEVTGSLTTFVTALAEQERVGESAVAAVETGAPAADPDAGPVDLAWSSTTAAGESRVRYYHAERRDGQVIAWSLTTSGMPLWDRYAEVIEPFRRSLHVEPAAAD